MKDIKLKLNITGTDTKVLLDLKDSDTKSNLINIICSMAHKARVLIATNHLFDIVAHDIDTDRVYTFGFNYTDEVLVSITDIDGSYEEGTCPADTVINKIESMEMSGLYEFSYVSSNDMELIAQG